MDETKENRLSFLKSVAENTIEYIQKNYTDQTFCIWSQLKESNIMENEYLSSKQNVLLWEVAELKNNYSNILHAFKIAPNRQIKNTILSLLPERYSYESIIIAFKTARWQIQVSREHRKKYEAGAYAEPHPYHKDRLDMNKVKNFLEFICQSIYLQDVGP
jgi:hypothetical protein